MKGADLLVLALALITIGMAVIVIAVVSPGLFFPGVYLIDAGMAALAFAGVLHLAVRPQQP